MILIVASALDNGVREVAAAWSTDCAAVLTPGDACKLGWKVELNDFDESCAVVDGKVIPVRDITGVVTLLPNVMDYELFGVEDADRRYVASEVMAFLFYLLSRLQCPVLNRPTAHCLTGPNWRPEQWSVLCRRVGLYTQPPCVQPSKDTRRISVVGSDFVGEAPEDTRARVRQLARLASVEHLTITLGSDDYAVRGIELAPDLRDEPVRSAVQRYFGAAA